MRVGRRTLEFHNTDQLVRSPAWNIVVQKTGYITEAGRCLVIKALIRGPRDRHRAARFLRALHPRRRRAAHPQVARGHALGAAHTGVEPAGRAASDPLSLKPAEAPPAGRPAHTPGRIRPARSRSTGRPTSRKSGRGPGSRRWERHGVISLRARRDSTCGGLRVSIQ